jgi:hypothetical protein
MLPLLLMHEAQEVEEELISCSSTRSPDANSDIEIPPSMMPI